MEPSQRFSSSVASLAASSYKKRAGRRRQNLPITPLSMNTEVSSLSLFAKTQLFKRLCASVRRSVGWLYLSKSALYKTCNKLNIQPLSYYHDSSRLTRHHPLTHLISLGHRRMERRRRRSRKRGHRLGRSWLGREDRRRKEMRKMS